MKHVDHVIVVVLDVCDYRDARLVGRIRDRACVLSRSLQGQG